MTNRRRGAAIAALIFGFATIALADEPIPPLPLKRKPTHPPNATMPEVRSPCTFDLDAAWLKLLKTTRTESVKIRVPEPINCEGAVINSILARGGGSVTTLQFTVAFRPGRDREGIISFGMLDSDKQLVALGETRDNLDEGADSRLSGTLTLKNREFDRVFANGQKPALRVTLRIEDN